MIVWEISGSNFTLKDGSSSWRVWSPEAILSSSPFAFGTIAPLITAPGNWIGFIVTERFFDARVLFVWVSFSLTTAPISPAISWGISFLLCPFKIESWLSLSVLLLVSFNISRPAFMLPEKTLNKDISPTCCSDIVLKINITGSPEGSYLTRTLLLELARVASSPSLSVGEGQ